MTPGRVATRPWSGPPAAGARRPLPWGGRSWLGGRDGLQVCVFTDAINAQVP